jgi:hypothetical protein
MWNIMAIRTISVITASRTSLVIPTSSDLMLDESFVWNKLEVAVKPIIDCPNRYMGTATPEFMDPEY